jgi:predicted phosphoribosyltransferase
MLFADRTDAGRRLAREVAQRFTDVPDELPVVLGLPRGGVPVAFEVARALGAPLDVVVVRKLGAPINPEFAIGAIGEDDVRVVDQATITALRVSGESLASIEASERRELARRAKQFRGDRDPLPVDGKVVVIVDDGIATGATARAACTVVRARGARRVVLAVPVAPADWVDSVNGEAGAPVADEYIALETPAHFMAVGQWYNDFRQTTDDEVVSALERALLG